jgi:hypothetical protein
MTNNKPININKIILFMAALLMISMMLGMHLSDGEAESPEHVQDVCSTLRAKRYARQIDVCLDPASIPGIVKNAKEISHIAAAGLDYEQALRGLIDAEITSEFMKAADERYTPNASKRTKQMFGEE